MIGDRPNTDIALGKKAGIDTCLVMTGVVKSKEDFAQNWSENPEHHPTYFMESLGGSLPLN